MAMKRLRYVIKFINVVNLLLYRIWMEKVIKDGDV